VEQSGADISLKVPVCASAPVAPLPFGGSNWIGADRPTRRRPLCTTIRHACSELVVDADAADTDVVVAGREGHIACAGSVQVAIRKR
jgi:hypothetical protein